MWVAHGTTIIRSAPENLRPASLREWQSLTDTQLTEPWKNAGGASSFVDLTGVSPDHSELTAAPESSTPAVPTVLEPVPALAPVTPNVANVPSEDLGQPEQELTPQVSQETPEVERSAAAAPSVDPVSSVAPATDPTTTGSPLEPQDIPVPENLMMASLLKPCSCPVQKPSPMIMGLSSLISPRCKWEIVPRPP